MGSTYVNIQMYNKRGLDSNEIKKHLEEFIRTKNLETEMAYYYSEDSKWITIYGDQMERFTVEPNVYLTELSQVMECPCILSAVFDSDDLYMYVVDGEEVIDEIKDSGEGKKLKINREGWEEQFGSYDYERIENILLDQETFMENRVSNIFKEFGIHSELSEYGYGYYLEEGLDGFIDVE